MVTSVPVKQTEDTIELYNWNTGMYEHYSIKGKTKSQIEEIKNQSKHQHNPDEYRKEYESVQFHDMNEYQNELMEEFADEFDK
jgi:hypothetical protein|tara:strand:+ start:265 stop:513 length:249 start_codon:yes stop_codon:yes gene_type:complete